MNRERKDRGKVDGPAPPRPQASCGCTELQLELGHRDACPERLSYARQQARAASPRPSRVTYASIGDGPFCPTGGQAHGRMYKLSTKWYCPSQLHNGAPVTAKDGPREPTQHSFTDEEVLQSQQSH